VALVKPTSAVSYPIAGCQDVTDDRTRHFEKLALYAKGDVIGEPSMLFPAALCIVMGLATLPVLSQTEESNGPDTKCQTEQLTTSIPDGPAGGLGHGALVYQVTNASQKLCTLEGVPSLRLFDDRKRKLELSSCAECDSNIRLTLFKQQDSTRELILCPNCGDYLFPARPSEVVHLHPGESAHFLVGWYHYEGPEYRCVRVSRVEVLLATTVKPLIFTLGGSVCDKLDVSTWQPGPFRDASTLKR
jgi:Protein of unknown function (DUF4232)